MSRKRAIAAPLSFNHNTSNAENDEDQDYSHHEGLAVGSTTGVCDLNDSLRSSLDPQLIEYYDMMVAGNADAVPAHFKRLVQRQVRLILDEGNRE